MAAFVDLRKFVERHCHTNGVKLRPSTNLRGVLPDCDWRKFDRFVQARFGARGLIRRRFLGLVSPRWAWLMFSVVTAVLIGKLFQWQVSGLLLGSLVSLVVFGILVMRLSRMTWRRGPSTVREVVEWILKRRSRLVAGWRELV
jgi:hypothetical protein